MANSDVEIRISIPSDVYQSIKQSIIGSSYNNVEQYIRSIVMETVSSSSAYSSEEEADIKKRLASLGYE